MATFIGLDLAWTPHHESGVCVIEGAGNEARLAVLRAECRTPAEFAEFCSDYGDDVVVAIDAPLIVAPGRCAERELARVFGSAKASPYTATMQFLSRMNGLAGPTLAVLLRERGFAVVPSALASVGGRCAVEVFPHPAHVELFSLAERIRYKKGPLAARRLAMADYQAHLGNLLARELPGVHAAPAVSTLLSPDVLCVGGRVLKAVEDQLDAITCAYTAYHCRAFGPAGFRVFGDDRNGAIVVPLRVARPLTSFPAPSSPSG